MEAEHAAKALGKKKQEFSLAARRLPLPESALPLRLPSALSAVGCSVEGGGDRKTACGEKLSRD